VGDDQVIEGTTLERSVLAAGEVAPAQ